MTFDAYIAYCVTWNLPIDRTRLVEASGLFGGRLEKRINASIVAFCMESQGRTGWETRHYARRGKPFERLKERIEADNDHRGDTITPRPGSTDDRRRMDHAPGQNGACGPDREGETAR